MTPQLTYTSIPLINTHTTAAAVTIIFSSDKSLLQLNKHTVSVKKKMSKNRALKSRTEKYENFEFKFSNFQVLQVPKGWDRLSVSLVHVETGKTMAKFGKGVVRNGSCQWTEILSETVHISRSDDSSKGYQECLVKIIVSAGSTRSSTLGEATINVAQYASSRISPAVSQPLKKCIYGTVLQLKIHCLTSRSKTGGEESKNSSCQEKDINMCSVDLDSKSYISDNSSDSKETSQLNSSEGSTGKEDLSRKSASKSEEYQSFGNEAGGSYNSSQIPVYQSVSIISSPNHSSSNVGRYMREDYKNEEIVKRTIGSSKHLLEASEDNIDELRAEAKMWERNARRLMSDLDLSRKELSEMSKKQSELETEHGKLKVEFGKMTKNQLAHDSIVQSENLNQIQKLLESEMKYQRDLNDDLGQQLKRSQESNIELVSVLQELEETIEQQRNKIEKTQVRIDELENERRSNEQILLRVEKDYECKLSAKEEEIASLEATLSGYVKGEHFEALDDHKENYNSDPTVREVESLKLKIEELEKDCAELTEENLELLLKLKDSNKITDIRNCGSFDSMSSESETNDPTEERKWKEMENNLSGLQEENVRLKRRVSELESQIRRLEGEKEACQQERDHFKSVATTLEHESEDKQKQLLLTREECHKYEAEIQDLTRQLGASEQSHEKLMAGHERALKLLENHKVSEEKLNRDLNEAELKRQQLTKEIGILKVELGNIPGLEDEITNLKGELQGCKVDKRKLELALKTVSGDKEEMKAENILLSKKISDLLEAVPDFDDCKRNKLVLGEKLMQMESLKETIRIQNEDLKRENTQFKKKMHRLEEEKIECLKKAQALEEEVVKLAKEKENIRKEGAKNHERSPLSVGQKKQYVSSKKPSINGEVVARERYEMTNSSLETELRDLRERYLEMSLKYAEVEGEREALVMKLRANKAGKRWFS